MLPPAMQNLCAAALLLLSLSNIALGKSSWFGIGQPEKQPGHNALASSTTTFAQTRQNALKWIDDLESQTSCQRAATKGLFLACDGFDPKQFGDAGLVNPVAEDFQKLYAIRMAHCELDGTDISLPSSCLSLLPEHPYSAQDVPRQVLLTCHAAIERLSTNAWTTYQRLKTRTDVMCGAIQVARHESGSVQFPRALLEHLDNVQEAFDNILVNLRASLNEELDRIKNSSIGLGDDIRNMREEVKGGVHEWEAGVGSALATLQRQAADVMNITNQLDASMDIASEKAAAFGADIGNYSVSVAGLNIDVGRIQSQLYSTEMIISSLSKHSVEIVKNIVMANNASSRVFALVHHAEGELKVGVERVDALNWGLGLAISQQQALQNITRETRQEMDNLKAAIVPWVRAVNGCFGWLEGFKVSSANLKRLLLVSAAVLVILRKCVDLPLSTTLIVAIMTGTALSTMVAPWLRPIPTAILDDYALSVSFAGLVILAFSAGLATEGILRTLSTCRQGHDHDLKSSHSLQPSENAKWSV